MRVFVVCLLFALSQLVASNPTKTIAQNLQADPDLTSLVSILSVSPYTEILTALALPGNYTFFAPNNKAIAAAGLDPVGHKDYVFNLFLYHMVNGAYGGESLGMVQFLRTFLTSDDYVNIGKDVGQVIGVYNQSQSLVLSFGIPGVSVFESHVVTADFVSSNGVYHKIDAMLDFPTWTTQVQGWAGLAQWLAAIAKIDSITSTNVSPSLTFFVPSDAAFAASNMSSWTFAQLKAVLAYHIVNLVIYSTELPMGDTSIPTAEGSAVTVHVTQETIQVNDANVIATNALTMNGVIHVIDKVLIPAHLKLLTAV